MDFSISEPGIHHSLRHLWGLSHLYNLPQEMPNLNVLLIFPERVAFIFTPRYINAMMILTEPVAQLWRYKMVPKWTWRKRSYSQFFATIPLPGNAAYAGRRALNVSVVKPILQRHPALLRCSCEHLGTSPLKNRSFITWMFSFMFQSSFWFMF